MNLKINGFKTKDEVKEHILKIYEEESGDFWAPGFGISLLRAIGTEEVMRAPTKLINDTILFKRFIPLKISFDGGFRLDGAIRERGLFIVNDDVVSIFEVGGYTDSEIIKLATDNTASEEVLKLAYAHFIKKKKYDEAKAILLVSIESVANNNDKTIPELRFEFYSNSSSEYIPALSLMRDYDCVNKRTLAGYMKALTLSNDLPNPFDRSAYNRIYKENKKAIAKIDISSYFEGTNDGVVVNYFDLIDSDINAAQRIFRIFDKESADIVRKLFKDDEERAEKALVDYINNIHQNGRKKSQFILMYRRLKDILDKEGKSINILKLNAKVQSYILLDILT